MNSEFELIRYDQNLPARIEMQQGSVNTPYHWHKEIELVYVMEGDVRIKINTRDRVLHADEFVLMNSAENHSISSENAKCLILDISYEFAEQFDASLYSSVFRIAVGSGAEEELHNLLCLKYSFEATLQNIQYSKNEDFKQDGEEGGDEVVGGG